MNGAAASRQGTAHVLVLGGAERFSGNTVLALHAAIALRRAGCAVELFDLDLAQRALTCMARLREDRDLVVHAPADVLAFAAQLRLAAARCAYLVIDAPAAETSLVRAAYASADTLVTTLLVADTLGRAPKTGALAPSAYSEMVWEARKHKALARGGPIDWVVIRNRAGRKTETALAALAGRMGFRLAPGLSERPIIAALSERGLTGLDRNERISMTQVALRQEMREWLFALGLPAFRAVQAA